VQLDVNSLVDLTLAFVIYDTDGANRPRVGYVRAAVGLQIQTLQLDGAYFLDPCREQVYLRADQVWSLERLGARQTPHPDRARRDNLRIARTFNVANQPGAHRLKLEVHTALQRVHIPPGDSGAVVA